MGDKYQYKSNANDTVHIKEYIGKALHNIKKPLEMTVDEITENFENINIY